MLFREWRKFRHFSRIFCGFRKILTAMLLLAQILFLRKTVSCGEKKIQTESPRSQGTYEKPPVLIRSESHTLAMSAY